MRRRAGLLLYYFGWTVDCCVDLVGTLTKLSVAQSCEKGICSMAAQRHGVSYDTVAMVVRRHNVNAYLQVCS